MENKADKALIKSYGGPAKLARMLGFSPSSGTQRVHNWMKRGISAQAKLDYPGILLHKAKLKEAE